MDNVITAADFASLEEVLTSFLAELRNDAAVRGVDLAPVWDSALMFATTMMRHRGAVSGDIQEMNARLVRLNALYTQLAPAPKKSMAPLRALPAAVVQDLYEIFDPSSKRNPFRTKAQRCRNWLLFILYLHLGLRRGEALMLSVDAFHAEYDHNKGEWYRWVNVTTLVDRDEDEAEGYEDPRSVAPSLKSPQSRRQLPVTEDVLRLVENYVDSWRGKVDHPYLFSSQKRSPIAPQTVGDAFALATEGLSERAKSELKRRGKRSVSPHDCRHTAAVVRLKRYKDQGMDTQDALGKMRVYFGWSSGSAMPMHYARAYWLTDAADAIDARFDAHVNALRELDAKLSDRGIA